MLIEVSDQLNTTTATPTIKVSKSTFKASSKSVRRTQTSTSDFAKSSQQQPAETQPGSFSPGFDIIETSPFDTVSFSFE